MWSWWEVECIAQYLWYLDSGDANWQLCLVISSYTSAKDSVVVGTEDHRCPCRSIGPTPWRKMQCLSLSNRPKGTFLQVPQNSVKCRKIKARALL